MAASEFKPACASASAAWACANAAEADEALEHETNAAWRDYVTTHADWIEMYPPPDRSVAFRVVQRVFKLFGPVPRGSEVGRLLDRLEAGAGGNLAGVLATFEGQWNTPETPRWVFRPEPPRRTG